MRELSLDMVVPYENLNRVYSSKFFKYDKKYIEQSKQEFGFRYIPHVKESHYEEASYEDGKVVYKPVKENETEVHRITVYPCVTERATAKGYEAPIVDVFEKTGLKPDNFEEMCGFPRSGDTNHFIVWVTAPYGCLKKYPLKLSDIVKNTEELQKLKDKGLRVVWMKWDDIIQDYKGVRFERGEDGELHELDDFQQAVGNKLDAIVFQIIDPWNAILEEGNEAGYYKFKE